ncbi:MAG: asparaginase [Candidatus Obscuribacterales bacterium]|nr:asparaginase [Candidatus Obscuribacterales bacterium]
MIDLPWAPILTVKRSALPEMTIYGIISVVDGNGRSLLAAGNQDAVLWTRSVLKPWQLLNHLHVLKKHYPQLKDEHYALMLSSHSAEPIHEQALDEIFAVGGVDESVLQNTPLFPYSAKQRVAVKKLGEKPKSRWGSCSGKHAGFVLALNALHEDAAHYLDKDAPHFVRLKKLLGYLAQEDWRSIPETTDGCRLPNYGFKASTIARLYCQLQRSVSELGLSEAPSELQEALAEYETIGRLMFEYPLYVGGEERLDSELMQGKYSDLCKCKVVAKEGADGLLTIGVAPSTKYPRGLGILIKSSAGDNARIFSWLAAEIFYQLGLLCNEKAKENQLAHIERVFHFQMA